MTDVAHPQRQGASGSISATNLFDDPAAHCGNIFRVEWSDGTQTGYPSEAIRDRAIIALAAKPKGSSL